MSFGFDPTGTADRFGRRPVHARAATSPRADWQRTGRRLLAWIASRPTENWLFFGAGALIASVLL